MSFLSDSFGIFKKRDLSFIKRYEESKNVYTFVFAKDNNVTWKAGQHGLFQITHKTFKNPIRPFSVATAPTENTIDITTRIGENPSDFKSALLELEQGMKIKMSGPVGSFYLKDNTPTLLIAGGMGITPFRSILKQVEAEDNNERLQLSLVYMDSNRSYLFKDELDNIAKSLPLNITYLDSRDSLQREIDTFTSAHMNNSKYFIAGSKSLVASVSTHLQNNNISKRNIKKDVLIGY